MIMSDLQEYKILPLTINIDLHSINKYYWPIKGKFLTKEPLTRDELQPIMINKKKKKRYKYAIDKVNFNSIINYKEVIETILAVDNRILMVDLDPIEYTDEEGNSISKSQLTGDYTVTIPKLNNSTAADNLHYTFKLANAPLLPGSIMIRVNDGQWTLRDNNNGAIYNVDNILTRNGSVDYLTCDLDIEFVSEVDTDLIVDYVHNETNIAVYKNLSTQTFYFDASSLVKDDMQDLV